MSELLKRLERFLTYTRTWDEIKSDKSRANKERTNLTRWRTAWHTICKNIFSDKMETTFFDFRLSLRPSSEKIRDAVHSSLAHDNERTFLMAYTCIKNSIRR